MIVVKCQCGSRFQVGDEWAGKQARCPVCSAVVGVDESMPAPAAAPAGPQFAPPTQPPSNTAVEPDAAMKTVHEELQTRVEEQAAPESQPPVTGDEAGNDALLRVVLLATVVVATVVLSGLGYYAYSTSSPNETEVIASASDTTTPTELQNDPTVDPPHEVAEATSYQNPESNGGGGEAGVPAKPLQEDPPKPKQVPVQPVAPDIAVDPPRETPAVTKGNDRVKKSGGGLSGISSQYDDFHCQRIQSQFAWRVLAAAEFLEVDGERLPITNLGELRKARAPYLFLPRGEHAIRLRAGEQPVRTEIAEHFEGTAAAMRKFFATGGAARTNELLSRGARAMDVHGAPFLLNMTGAAYVADDQWKAAERKFRRALVVNPLYAPAHLNLAVCLFKTSDTTNAARELQLADALNVGNVFGLAGGVNELRRQHGIAGDPSEAIALDVSQYVSAEPLSAEDERLTALMTAMSKYAVREEDRGKILNNLAVHFSDTGKTETALEHFRSALRALKFAGPERFKIAERVLSHMETVCRDSGFPEAEEYAFMRKSVLP